MRRFSSEGSLLDLDLLPWKRATLIEPGCEVDGEAGTYSPCPGEDPPLGVRMAVTAAGEESAPMQRQERGKLVKELSVSMENLSGLEKLEHADGFLGVGAISEGCRAYSDSQLAPGAAKGEQPSPIASPTSAAPYSARSLHRQHARAKLAAAKLHLKSLFGQNHQTPHPAHVSSEQRDSESRTRERRSRLPFLRQWSQVGHGNTSLSREELLSWAESLNVLLASRTGQSVFGAFLRSEFSEENLQFYLACEQYRHSSTNFSLQRRARDICATYIQPGASREVNLDGKTRELTMQLLQAPSRSSLCPAQRRIFSLLDTDCYPRFLQSHLYQSLLKDAH